MYKDGKKRQHATTNLEKAGVALWISDKGIKNDITAWHKRSIHQEDVLILNVHVANKRTMKQTKQKWTEMKRETDKSVITAEDVNEYLSLRNRTSRRISNSAEERNQARVTFREQSTRQKWNTHFQVHMDHWPRQTTCWLCKQNNADEGTETLQNVFPDQNRLYRKSVTERLKKTLQPLEIK